MLVCAVTTLRSAARSQGDGFYLWNSSHVTWWVTNNLELDFANKDHYSQTLGRLDYYHLDLTAYRKLTNRFLLGLGFRQTESYKTTGWNPGHTLLLYGVLNLNPGDVKIKFSNRVTAKLYRSAETIYGLDNITNVDFFARSASKLPKPYLMDEVFSNLNSGKIQTVRLYGGFRLFKTRHFGLDLFYCWWQTRPAGEWYLYHVVGVNTKVFI